MLPACIDKAGTRNPLLCSAAAKAGHSVLQLDPSDHYGGAWASLPLDELSGVLRDAGADVGALTGAASQPGQQPDLQLPSGPAAANDGEQQESGLMPTAPGAAAAAGIRDAQVWPRTGADLGPLRQYCLDLAPKVGKHSTACLDGLPGCISWLWCDVLHTSAGCQEVLFAGGSQRAPAGAQNILVYTGFIIRLSLGR